MKLEILLIRNGLTQYGKEGRCLGSENEPLCSEGIRRLKERLNGNQYPEVARVYTSAYERCRETAIIIYPRFLPLLVKGMEPFDFGVFEGKGYNELSSDARFAEWAGSEEITAFPEGKPPRQLLASNIKVFNDIIDDLEHSNVDRVALVTHRSIIYMILNRYLQPGIRYFGVDLPPGGGVRVEIITEHKLLRIKSLI